MTRDPREIAQRIRKWWLCWKYGLCRKHLTEKRFAFRPYCEECREEWHVKRNHEIASLKASL